MGVLLLIIVIAYASKRIRPSPEEQAEFEMQRILEDARESSFREIHEVDPKTRAWLDGVRRSLALGNRVRNHSANLADDGANRKPTE